MEFNSGFKGLMIHKPENVPFWCNEPLKFIGCQNYCITKVVMSVEICCIWLIKWKWKLSVI